MIDFSVLPVYLTAVVALLLIPGPDMLLITSASLSYGKKVGVFASLGNATSGVILTVLAALGVSAIIAMNATALEVLRLVGAAYLCKMGWDCITSEASDSAPNVENQQHLAKILYRRAMFSNLLNPKALLFFVLFLPQFVSTHIATSSGEQLLVLGLLLNIMGLMFNLVLVIAVRQIGQALLQGTKFRYYQHKIMGGVFFILAIWLILDQIIAK